MDHEMRTIDTETSTLPVQPDMCFSSNGERCNKTDSVLSVNPAAPVAARGPEMTTTAKAYRFDVC
jgi:hypothetical protein